MKTSEALIADIGGTNARFTLIDSQGNYLYQLFFTIVDYPTIEDAIHTFITSSNYLQPKIFALAVACPAHDDEIKITNSNWYFNKKKMACDFRLHKLIVLNDFAALAYAIPFIENEHLEQWGGDTNAVGSKAVVGAGTGLGVSGLIYNQFSQGNDFSVIEGEGGHISCIANNDFENAIICQIRKKTPRVSAERLLSGAGIATIYTALCEIESIEPQYDTPQQISEQAILGTCTNCSRTLAIYCSMFGSFVGDLALTLGATGGVYIGGGVIPKFKTIFYQSDFRSAFENKGRFRCYMEKIPVYLITAKVPAFDGIVKALGYK